MKLRCKLFGHTMPLGYDSDKPYLTAGPVFTDANHKDLRNGGRVHVPLECDCDYCGTKFTVAYAHIGSSITSIDQAHLEKSRHILPPKINSWWKHHNGNMYKVIAISNQHSDNWDYLPTVVYRGNNGNVWSRPVYDWYRSFTELITVEWKRQ